VKTSRPGQPWYASGLRFACEQCQSCCRGAQPGWVYVTPLRIRRIAGFLGRSATWVRRRLVRRDEDGELVLKLRRNGDCIFWDNGCTIYPERPRQCRTFPFWGENLKNRAEWAKLGQFCPGIDKGRRYGLAEIRSIFKGRGTAA
jgi:Fe-S-cluster containining protein